MQCFQGQMNQSHTYWLIFMQALYNKWNYEIIIYYYKDCFVLTRVFSLPAHNFQRAARPKGKCGGWQREYEGQCKTIHVIMYCFHDFADFWLKKRVF